MLDNFFLATKPVSRILLVVFPPLPASLPRLLLPGLLAMLALLPLRGADRPVPLVWDATFKEVVGRAGDTNVQVSFSVTNQSASSIVIHDVSASCACSRVIAPARPWILSPGESGKLAVVTDVRGKSGALVKTIVLSTSVGLRAASYRIAIQEPLSEAQRKRNQELAQANRQAVFQGECAKCHLEPMRSKTGGELFAAACGICHEAEHRASMVPYLRPSKHPATRVYWLKWITEGKEGTLMPAFAQSAGGPLTGTQIVELAEWLVKSRTPAK